MIAFVVKFEILIKNKIDQTSYMVKGNWRLFTKVSDSITRSISGRNESKVKMHHSTASSDPRFFDKVITSYFNVLDALRFSNL